MAPVPNTYFRYLPVSAADRKWDFFATTAGYNFVPEGAAGYRPIMGLHPATHQFSWKDGRILRDLQIIYILRGQGVFETEDREWTIKGGDAFLLLPGQWHRYWPDPKVGWDEYWLGTDGDYVNRLISRNVFSAREPVFHPGHDPRWRGMFSETIETIKVDPLGTQRVLTGLAFQMLSRLGMLTQLRFSRETGEETGIVIQRAKALIAARLETELDAKGLADELGVGYSLFRHRFAQYTGFSPGQYQLQLRIEKAKHLLSESSMSVKEVSAALGVDPYYFSHLFKRQTGVSPTDWRRHGLR